MRALRFVPSDNEEGDQALPQFLKGLPNDLVVRDILPLLELSDLRRLRLVCKPWAALLSKGTVWSLVVCQEWFRSRLWLLMLCRTPTPTEMEFVACRLSAPNLPPSSEEDLDCWLSLSPAIQNTLSSFLPRFKFPDPTPDRRTKNCTMYPLDDRCLISGIRNLMCIIWHPDHRRRPLRPYSRPQATYLPPELNTASYTPMLLDVVQGSAIHLEPPAAYFRFKPDYGSGRPRNVFMSMQIHHQSKVEFWSVILHDDLLNYVEVYSSLTASWRTVVDRRPRSTDDYPCLKFTTRRVHLGDIFAIRCHGAGAVYAYSAGFDEWSKVDVQYPANARQRYSRAFKYADRVFLAALLMKNPPLPLALDDEFQPDAFHGFGIWELKHMPADTNAYFWGQVATSKYDDEYRESFHSLSKFEIKFVNLRGFVCMTSASICGKEVRKFPPLICDIDSKSWFLLPDCKSVMDCQCVFGF